MKSHESYMGTNSSTTIPNKHNRLELRFQKRGKQILENLIGQPRLGSSGSWCDAPENSTQGWICNYQVWHIGWAPHLNWQRPGKAQNRLIKLDNQAFEADLDHSTLGRRRRTGRASWILNSRRNLATGPDLATEQFENPAALTTSRVLKLSPSRVIHHSLF